MIYCEIVTLKDGRDCLLRNGTERDGKAVLDNFILTHEQTDYLLSYPDETNFTPEQEGRYLQEKTDSRNEIEILAVLDGEVVGTAGVDCVGPRAKTRHRAELGVSIDRKYWGLGIGRALTRACIDCARKAGYAQLELEVVAENETAIGLYLSEGFIEFGRNPLGFRSRHTGWQEIISMRLEL